MTRTRFLHAAMIAAGVAASPGLALAQSATPAPSGTSATPARPAQPPMATSAAPVTGEQVRMADARRASRIIGANIYNEENRSIGEVHDLLVAANGTAPTAVLSVGGFLGIGDRYVAVPLANLQWNAERERWVLPGATVDSLKARPAFTYPERS